MEVVIISEQGERPRMEDRHYFERNFGSTGTFFGGVYDGHSGSTSAEIASTDLHNDFKKALSSNLEPDKAFEFAYRAIHEKVNDKSGTCAANIFIKEGKIYFANAGDCRIIITGSTKARQLTIDDSASNGAECKRVIRAGAIRRGHYFWRGYAGTQVTRSIGDLEFKGIGVVSDPHTGVTDILSTDRYLVVASDGLFKFVSNDEIQDISTGANSAGVLAETLKEKVLTEREGSDNLTIIVLALNQF